MIVRPSRTRTAVAGATSFAVATGLCLLAASPAAAIETSWAYDAPGRYEWTVPDGVTTVYVELWGAYGGGQSVGTDGGSGAYVEAEVGVMPGETYDVYVGGTGDDRSSAVDAVHAGGFNGGGDGGARGRNGVGGGGGGATDIRFGGAGLSDRFMVAAGGGGTSSTAGGDATAEAGSDGDSNDALDGGGGGAVDGGGAGAAGFGASAGLGQGEDGALGQGGAGQYDDTCRYTGGGGGGGVFGGGGGGCENNSGGSGGGAGSSMVIEGGTIDIGGGNPDEDSDGYALISLITPDPPTDAPTAVAGDSRATVSWAVTEYGGSMDVTGYTATSDPGGRTCSTHGAMDTSCVVTGLTNGTEYTFTVVSNSAAGDSDPSDPSEPVTPLASSVAPTVSFPAHGAFLSRWTVLRSWGSPMAALTTSTPSVCRVTGPSVVFLRAVGACRLAVTQDGSVVARAYVPVAVAGSGSPINTRLIGFQPGSPYLTAAAKAKLATWAPALKGSVLVVTGWVSGMRTTAADRVLSAERARVISAYLATFGVRVSGRYGAGSHWVGSSAASRAAQVSWYAAPRVD